MKSNLKKEERTGKEIAAAIEKACVQINAVHSAYVILGDNYPFFNADAYKKDGVNKLISDKAAEFGISEKHLRTILA
jgi:hypothetical protein